ncbi:MAG: hypothetical protein ACREIA_13420 [Opitutaceae bacterium]
MFTVTGGVLGGQAGRVIGAASGIIVGDLIGGPYGAALGMVVGTGAGGLTGAAVGGIWGYAAWDAWDPFNVNVENEADSMSLSSMPVYAETNYDMDDFYTLDVFVVRSEAVDYFQGNWE